MNTTTGNYLEDKPLVDQVLGGDQRAFARIIKNTEKLVAQIVFKMISNPEDRKDLAQDIYVKVYKKLPGFRFQSKLSTWIAQIGYNTCLDHLRKKKLLLTGNVPGDEDAPDEEMQKFSWTPGAMDTMVTSKNLAGILQNEIDKLSPVYRTLITLYHKEELSYEEMEQVTGMPEGTIKNYLFRARKALQKSLLLTYKKEDL